MWRRAESATLDDVVELLRGIGMELMTISVTLESIEAHLGGDDNEADT